MHSSSYTQLPTTIPNYAPQPIYRRERRSDGTGVVFTPLNRKQAKGPRMSQAMTNYNTTVLNEHRPLTVQECDAAGWWPLSAGPAYMSYSGGEFLLAKYVSPQENFDAGRFPIMTEIRDYFLGPERQQFLADVQIGRHSVSRGTAYDFGFIAQPHHAGVVKSRIAKVDPDSKIITKQMIDVVTDIVKKAVPDFADPNGLHVYHAIKQASVTIGSEENHFFSSIQVNITPLATKEVTIETLGDDLGASLKKKGHAHVDGNDVPTYLTVCLFLGSPPPGWYEGRFHIYSTKIFCEAACFGALIFTAKHPHNGRGFGFYKNDTPQHLQYSNPPGLVMPAHPVGSPYARIAIPIYPRNNLMTPSKNEMVFLRDVPEGSRLPDDLLTAFGTHRNMYTWQMLFEINNRDKSGDHRDSVAWCDKFAWTDEHGILRRPQIWLAEMALKEDAVKDAKYKVLYEATLDTACGRTMPQDSRQRVPRGQGRKRIPGEKRIVCEGIRVRKSGEVYRCKTRVKASRHGNNFCLTHQSQAGN